MLYVVNIVACLGYESDIFCILKEVPSMIAAIKDVNAYYIYCAVLY